MLGWSSDLIVPTQSLGTIIGGLIQNLRCFGWPLREQARSHIGSAVNLNFAYDIASTVGASLLAKAPVAALNSDRQILNLCAQ